MFLRSRACRSRGPMPLETFARLAAAVPSSRSGFRNFGAMKCGDYTEARARAVFIALCSLTLYIFPCHAQRLVLRSRRRTYNTEIAEITEKTKMDVFSAISVISVFIVRLCDLH